MYSLWTASVFFFLDLGSLVSTISLQPDIAAGKGDLVAHKNRTFHPLCAVLATSGLSVPFLRSANIQTALLTQCREGECDAVAAGNLLRAEHPVQAGHISSCLHFFLRHPLSSSPYFAAWAAMLLSHLKDHFWGNVKLWKLFVKSKLKGTPSCALPLVSYRCALLFDQIEVLGESSVLLHWNLLRLSIPRIGTCTGDMSVLLYTSE